MEILNEKDCIKVKPKGWLDKQVWKEINDILRVHQFGWLSNGKESCWIMMWTNGKVLLETRVMAKAVEKRVITGVYSYPTD